MASDCSSSVENPNETKLKTKRVLSTAETQFIESVSNGEVDNVKRLLAEGVRVDCLDETHLRVITSEVRQLETDLQRLLYGHTMGSDEDQGPGVYGHSSHVVRGGNNGMTPLQHGAYKGHSEMCELLLNHGADVNSNSHDHGYTALMFGALSGKKDVVRVLLERGACTGLENKIHRTATQMAAFIGQHEIVSLINNFFSREDLEYYCQKHGLETEPKLPLSLAPQLYKFILIVNLNPVKLSMYLSANVELLKQADRITRVLDCLCEKMMKQRDTNEILALKFSYLSYIVKHAAISYNKQLDKADDTSVLGSWIRFLLKGRESDGYPENQEQLVRAVLKEFPYVECQLLQQMIRTITTTAPEVGTVTAVNVLTSCINGQRFSSADDKICSTCGDIGGKTCHMCKSVHYCNKDCQKLHWFVHKKFCKSLAEDRALREELVRKHSEKENNPVQSVNGVEPSSNLPNTEEDSSVDKC